MASDIRRGFHNDLDEVRDDIVRLASMVTEALGKATQALLEGDLQTANELIQADDVTDTLAQGAGLTIKHRDEAIQLTEGRGAKRAV